MTTETAGPVERWVREVFDGTTRSLDDTYAQARQIDERVRMLVEALEATYDEVDAFAIQNGVAMRVDRSALAAFKEEA